MLTADRHVGNEGFRFKSPKHFTHERKAERDMLFP